LEIFIVEPNGRDLTWDFLAIPDGMKLARRYGPLPAPIFVGDERYPDDLQPLLKDILYQDNIGALEGLLNQHLRENPDFISLLRLRKLSDPAVIAEAISELENLYVDKPEAVVERIKVFCAMSDRDWNRRLTEIRDAETYNTPIATYRVVWHRIIAGQDVSKADYAIASVDAGCDLVNIFADDIANRIGAEGEGQVIRSAAFVAGFVNQEAKVAVANGRVTDQLLLQKASQGLSQDKLHQKFADFLYDQPSVILNSFLSLPPTVRASEVAATARYFWQFATRIQQMNLLTQNMGSMYLLPNGELVCVPKPLATSANSSLPKDQDTRQAWPDAAATWWQDLLVTSR
jgi:hypothetical protein